MAKSTPSGRESKDEYKKRLRLTALRTPQSAVIKMVKAMKRKAHLIWKAKGGDIDED